jgi:hypothetical protein
MEVEFLSYAYGAAAMAFAECLVCIPFLVVRHLRGCKDQLIASG